MALASHRHLHTLLASHGVDTLKANVIVDAFTTSLLTFLEALLRQATPHIRGEVIDR